MVYYPVQGARGIDRPDAGAGSGEGAAAKAAKASPECDGLDPGSTPGGSTIMAGARNNREGS